MNAFDSLRMAIGAGKDPNKREIDDYKCDTELRQALVELIKRSAFWGSIIQELTLVSGTQAAALVDTACVYPRSDFSIGLAFNPDMMETLDLDQRVAILMHELLHIVHDHFTRGKDMKNKKLANYAFDMAINQDIEGINQAGKDPKSKWTMLRPVLPGKYNQPENKPSEFYYASLLEMLGDKAPKKAKVKWGFAPGSMVLTPNGERPIEDLRSGDAVYCWSFMAEKAVVREVVQNEINRAGSPTAFSLYPFTVNGRTIPGIYQYAAIWNPGENKPAPANLYNANNLEAWSWDGKMPMPVVVHPAGFYKNTPAPNPLSLDVHALTISGLEDNLFVHGLLFSKASFGEDEDGWKPQQAAEGLGPDTEVLTPTGNMPVSILDVGNEVMCWQDDPTHPSGGSLVQRRILALLEVDHPKRLVQGIGDLNQGGKALLDGITKGYPVLDPTAGFIKASEITDVVVLDPSGTALTAMSGVSYTDTTPSQQDTPYIVYQVVVDGMEGNLFANGILVASVAMPEGEGGTDIDIDGDDEDGENGDGGDGGDEDGDNGDGKEKGKKKGKKGKKGGKGEREKYKEGDRPIAPSEDIDLSDLPELDEEDRLLDSHEHLDNKDEEGREIPPIILEEKTRGIIKRAQSASIQKGEWGSLPGGFRSMIEERIRPKIDWRKELRAFARTIGKSKKVTTRKRRNRRFSYDFPGHKKVDSSSRLIAAVDTSGSIGADEWTAFISEVEAIAKQGMYVIVVEIDAAIHRVTEIKPGKRFPYDDYLGHGGTDFRPLWTALQTKEVPDIEVASTGQFINPDPKGLLKKKPSGIIYLTDTYGDWPSKNQRMGIKTLWISTVASRLGSQPFGRMIYMDPRFLPKP